MSTPNPIQPTAAQVAATDVNNDMISMLLGKQASLLGEINYLQNAAANLTDRQNQLSAVQAQLTALGYVPPSP